MAFPWRYHQRVWNAKAASETVTLSDDVSTVPSIILSMELSGFSGTVDIQGRQSADHTYRNVRYAELTGDGALSVVNDQISHTTITATHHYQTVEYWPQMRLVMTRIAGTIIAGDVWAHEGQAPPIGPTSISGTVDTELPTAAALADNTATPTAPAVGAFGMVYDGSTWDFMRGTAAAGVTVDTELPAAVAAADNLANPTAPQVIAHLVGWDGTTWDRLPNGTTTSASTAALLVTPPSNSIAQGDGVNNTVTITSDSSGTITVSQRVINYLFNNSTWDRVRSIITGTNSTGTGIQAVGLVAQLDETSPAALTENQFGNVRLDQNHMLYSTPPEMWAVQHTPAENNQATISKAAGGGTVRHVCTSISATIATSAAPTATQEVINLRDGATGAGTILLSWTVSLQAVAGDRAGVVLGGLNIPGTANTAMTLEFATAGGTSTFEQVAMTGYDKIV